MSGVTATLAGEKLSISVCGEVSQQLIDRYLVDHFDFGQQLDFEVATIVSLGFNVFQLLARDAQKG